MANLYAEKIFAEHPIDIWSLDDNINYTSLITTQKNLSTWTGTALPSGTTATAITSGPFYQSPKISTVEETLITTTSTSVTRTTSSSITINNGTFTIGFYYYSLDPNLTSISIGYGSTLTSFTVSTRNQWTYISKTFNFASVTTVTPKIVLNYTYSSGTTSRTLINGISIGVNSEEFNMFSSGVVANSQTLFSFTNYVYPVSSFVNDGLPGYYVADAKGSNVLTAKNSSIPLVYGSNNCVILSANTDSGSNPIPSLLIPGYGMLNNAGKNKKLTLEFWARINAQTTTPRKIVGPISSSDGLYIDGSFLRFKIGSYIGSAYIQEWARPMLFQIEVGKDLATIDVNGEEVIRIIYQTSSLTFPDEFNSSTGKSQNYIGFYSYSDVPNFEIDCISIYGYSIPAQVAKKHLIYGQAVAYPNEVIKNKNGSAAIIDYGFANYSNNYNYPQNGNWSRGISDGVFYDKNVLGLPQYILPNFSSSDGTSLITDMSTMSTNASGAEFINLKPNGTGITKDWSTIESSIVFPKMDMINQKVKAFWINAKTGSSNPTADQVIFKIKNIYNGDYFGAVWSASDRKIRYSYNINGTSSTYNTSASAISTSTTISVGFDLDIVSLSNPIINNFLESYTQLKVYVGGDISIGTIANTTFTGNIYSICFSSLENYSYFSSNFNSSSGVISSTISVPTTSGKYATYTYLPQLLLDTYILDIATSGYWQDTIPLSTLATTTIDGSGNSTTALDYLQFNINYPQPITTADGSDGSSYNTSNNLLKMYALFQNTSDSSILKGNSSTITSTSAITNTNKVIAGTLSSTTRYELADNVLIYPPTGSSSSRNMNLYFELNSSAIYQNPIKIMSLQLASQASSTTAKIGTKFGTQISSSTAGSVNSFITSKDMTPHLWLTSKSGIALAGTPANTDKLNLAINPNPTSEETVSLTSIQFFARWNYEKFPSTTTPFMSITNGTSTTTFSIAYIDSNNTKRAIITSSDSTVKFYINGNLVNVATMDVRQWCAISIVFTTPFDFSNQSGTLSLQSKMNFENISYYLKDEYALTATPTWGYRSWYGVYYTDNTVSSPVLWSSLTSVSGQSDSPALGKTGKWVSIVYNGISQNVGTFPADVYSSLIGLTLFSIDVETVSSIPVKLKAHNAEYQMFTNTVPNNNSYTPV